MEEVFGRNGAKVIEKAQVLEGRSLAKRLRENLKKEVADFTAQHGFAPGLAVLLVGDDPSSIAYTRTLTKNATDMGFYGISQIMPAATSVTELHAALAKLNNEAKIHGIAVQWPTPAHISFEDVINSLDPRKDVDGYHPLNLGRLYYGLETFVPATPFGGMQLLEHYGMNVSGKKCLIIGHGVTVGRPLLALLLRAHASVTVANHSTPPEALREYASQAEFIFCAAGAPGLLKGDMVKPGVVVIDFGTSMVGEKLVGDADYESLLPVAKAITPTPGGTGPVTNVTLFANVLKAARQQVS